MEGVVATVDLLARARAGDGEAFGQLVEPYRRELQVHCYRMLGSVADAEDALQDTLLSAWRGLPGFQGRASVRTWLYRVATSRCLDSLRSAARRIPMSLPSPGGDLPAPTGLGEVLWLEPYPDVLLEGLADSAPGPEAHYQAREAISLAFIKALQLLPPSQRATLILRDVLGFHAGEVAVILGTSEASVTSALKRARARLQRQYAAEQGGTASAAWLRRGAGPGGAAHPGVRERRCGGHRRAAHRGRLADHAAAAAGVPGTRAGGPQFLTAVRLDRTWRLVATRANGQPAFGLYIRDPQAGVFHATGLLVLTLSGSRICAMTRFETSVLPRFGLPRTLPTLGG
jgi:RNA polymerase sigma-70 factor (ECF subfamily)